MVDLFFIIYVILGIVVLVCFFILCRNVSKIKAKLSYTDRDFLLSELKKHLAFNDEAQAKEVLKTLIWRYVEFIHKEHPTSPEVRIKKYQDIEGLYGQYMERLKIEFPNKEELSKI